MKGWDILYVWTRLPNDFERAVRIKALSYHEVRSYDGDTTA